MTRFDPPVSLLGRSLGRRKAKERNGIAFFIFSPKLRISRVVFACAPSAMLARHHIGFDLNVRNVYISHHVTLAKIARVSRGESGFLSSVESQELDVEGRGFEVEGSGSQVESQGLKSRVDDRKVEVELRSY